MSDVHKAIEKAMPFMQHVLTCESYQNNVDLSEPGSRRDHPCTCGYEEAYRGLQTVLLLSRGADNTRTVSQRAREIAEEVTGAANIVSHDGYYEVDIDAATEVIARFEEETLALSRDGEREAADQRLIERAKQLADAALILAPDSPDAHEVMGDLFIDASEPEDAEDEFRKALLGHDSASLRTKLAEALRLQGDFDQAITELRAAIKLEPRSARAYSGLGLALRGQRNLPESTAAYQEAIRLDPDLIDAHNGLAVVLANQGNLNDAVTEFREIIRIDPDSAIGYYNLSYALADLDRDVESAAALREVVRINPNHYNARFNLGELFRLEGKYDESVKQFREYLRLAPDAPQNRRNIERAKGYIQKFGDQ